MAPIAGYVSILKSLGTFFDLCAEVGLRNEAEQGRFGIYENRIRHLIALIEDIQRGVPEGPLFAKIATELPIYTESLTESLEVGRMTPFLNTVPKEVLKPLLNRIVRGPVLPSDESPSSNQARNVQFELSLAALLERAGVSASFREPDLRCQIGEVTFLVACKRIQSTKKLNTRINEATVQLERQLRGLPENAGGVVAISLSSVLATTDGKPTAIASQADGLRRMQSQIEEFVNRRAKWQKTREAQGILFHLTSTFTNHATGRIDSGSFSVIHGTGPIVEALAAKLEDEAKRYS